MRSIGGALTLTATGTSMPCPNSSRSPASRCGPPLHAGQQPRFTPSHHRPAGSGSSRSPSPPAICLQVSPSLSPASTLRFTGTRSQPDATNDRSLPRLIPLDCYPFTSPAPRCAKASPSPIWSCSHRVRRYPAPDALHGQSGNGAVRLRGLGATGKPIKYEAKAVLTDPLGAAGLQHRRRQWPLHLLTAQTADAPHALLPCGWLAPDAAP